MSVRRTTLAAAAVLTLIALLAAGCGGGSGQVSGRGAADREPTRSPGGDGAPEPERNQESPMQVQITIGDQIFTATLQESAAADDLLTQLPVTVEMTDHGGVEKTGPLPSSLSLDGQPEGADPDVGDLGYYAPGNDLVLYYGDQSYFPGIVVLGRLDGEATARIAELDGSVTATVEAG
jgi:hypothetical protein